MGANELRIGNIVGYKGTSEIAFVELIHKNHFDCRDEFGEFTPNAKYEPIPLTEEWLLKFGFKRIEVEGYPVFLNKIFAIEFYEEESDVLFENISIAQIKYVHQLQNLYFALTGEELTIKK